MFKLIHPLSLLSTVRCPSAALASPCSDPMALPCLFSSPLPCLEPLFRSQLLQNIRYLSDIHSKKQSCLCGLCASFRLYQNCIQVLSQISGGSSMSPRASLLLFRCNRRIPLYHVRRMSGANTQKLPCGRFALAPKPYIDSFIYMVY